MREEVEHRVARLARRLYDEAREGSEVVELRMGMAHNGVESHVLGVVIVDHGAGGVHLVSSSDEAETVDAIWVAPELLRVLEWVASETSDCRGGTNGEGE